MELAAALREATQMLCAAGGVLELDKLRKRLRGGQVTVEELLQCPRRLAVVTRGSGDQAQRVVLAVTEMRLCRATATCNGLCAQLHLCKFLFYGGACKFEKKAGNSCKNGHSLTTVHNQGVLKSYCVDHLSFSEICQLLFQNDPWLLPEICLHYNRGDGLHGSCTFQTQCTKIHVCQHFLQGDCKFEARCKRSHDFSSVETLVKLRKLGMGASLVHKLPAIYRNANDIKRQGSAPDTPLPGAQATSERRNSSGPVSPHSTSEEETDQICLYHIWKSCSFQDKCRRIHFHLPYRWQFLWSDKWIDLYEMERIEEAYSNPGTGRMYCSESADKKLVHWLCFDSMKFGTFPARRLSTASSVTKPPYFLLTTDWLWYWADEAGSWQEYGKQDTQHPVATVSSPDLEKAYLEYCAKGPNTQAATLEFKAGKHKYELDFKAFVQKNLQCSTVRKVRRRPKYVSPQDVTLKQTCKVQLQAPKNIPDYWDPAALPELGFKRVPLSPSSDEYRKVDELFSCTLPSYCIQKIQRVQNLALWEVYQWQKGQMQKRRGGQEVDERQLFHGTSASLVDAICQQNFDWRVCGLHGTSFGKGSYFAVDAAYSHHYAEANTQSHVMFLARVLVGEFVRGRASYVRPPAKEGQGDILYDSCVNSVTHPTIFVIFEKHQVYPEYLVQYTSSAAVAGLPHPLPLATDISRPLRPNLWGLLGR